MFLLLPDAFWESVAMHADQLAQMEHMRKECDHVVNGMKIANALPGALAPLVAVAALCEKYIDFDSITIEMRAEKLSGRCLIKIF